MNDDDLLRVDPTRLATLQVRLSAGPRCALCGCEYDDRAEEDLRYTGGRTAADGQSVHAVCWEGFTGLCERLGLDWQAAVEQEFAARRKKLGVEER